MHVNGLPLHPLVVHAAVVFVPLAAIAAGLYGVVVRWRWAVRWPMVVLGVLAAGSVQLAAMSGGDLKRELGIEGSLIHLHEMWAGRLQFASWVLLVAVAVAAWALPYTTPITGASDRVARIAVLRPVLMVLLPVLAIAELYLVYKTGDAGARAVWAGASHH
jgi:hypothetical protein